jgi:CelD/BcsL family acetyltransferase involved in cellulose biosynthesis
MRWQTRPIEELDSLRGQWQALNEVCGNSPLLDFDFVQPLLTHFPQAEGRLALLGSPDCPDAMAVVVPEGRWGWQTLQIPNSPLGLWLSRPEIEPEAAGMALLNVLPGLPLLFAITQQDPELLSRPAPALCLGTIDYITTARLTMNRPFEEYWQSRSKNLRGNIRRQLNKLEREGIEQRMEILTDPADMERAVLDHARMEETGWKGRAGSAVYAGDRQSRFYMDLLQRFCPRGEAAAVRTLFNGQPVASHLVMMRGGVWMTLKIAYDEERGRTTSPSLLLRYELLRHLFAKGARAFEFLGALRPWHLQWADDLRDMFHVNVYRWPLLTTLHGRRMARARQADAVRTCSPQDAEEVQ